MALPACMDIFPIISAGLEMHGAGRQVPYLRKFNASYVALGTFRRQGALSCPQGRGPIAIRSGVHEARLAGARQWPVGRSSAGSEVP